MGDQPGRLGDLLVHVRHPKGTLIIFLEHSLERPLVSVRKVTTHKLSRTSSRRFCPEIISKKQVQYPCKTNDGQCNSNKLYKQNGWAHIIDPVKPSLRPPAMCLQQSITVEAHHLPGRLNIVADFESRAHPDTSDWQLDPSIFQGINNKWGPFLIDLFASRLTAQLPRFVSWKPDPEAEDAFTLDWSQLRGYAFPPFALIGRCLRQVLWQSVSQLTIMAPVWETQPWYPLLLEMLIDNPMLLSSFPGLLKRENDVHPCPPSTSRMASLRSRYEGSTVSQPAQRLLLTAWRTRTERTYYNCMNNRRRDITM